MKFQYLLFFLLISFTSINLFSQSDTSKIKKIDNEVALPTNSGQLKVDFSKVKVNPNTNLNLKIDEKVNTEAINKNLSKYNTTNNSNFLLETLPEDRDITGKKYWNNKDVTHEKLKTAVSLGTLNSKTKTVKIECRDYSYVDGDRIRIYLNENVVSDNIGLKGNYYVYYLTLEKGYNKIDFQALNQGLSGPNTAELNVYDANGTLISSKEWGLATGEVATLGVLYY
ncbi:hypothetical protein [Lutibacter sp.]|jgi:biopolymer transport protein ExbD|uniref:hypothetical protein n=1 Tax=Lutibacter sp. TaxID=1925666 RepID=UPI001A25645E|nr:hypothetical protein [Lutibacter sp.]MBI9040686.1 hypothetical protein [Lutibacter sp.]